MTLTLHGPHAWFGENSIMTQPVGAQAGVYLWTIPQNGKFLTYYVGHTGRRFIDRLQEHAQEYLSGEYQIYDRHAFRQGRKIVIWQGLWRLGKLGKHDQFNEFLKRFPEIQPREFLTLFSIFILPVTGDRRLRERLEGGIGKTLEVYSEDLKAFLNDVNQQSLRPKRQEEEPYHVTIQNHEQIIGLPKTMTI